MHNRKEIKEVFLNYNKMHYKKVLSSPAYNDKITGTLKYDEVRENILNGTLEQETYDTQELYDFLCIPEWSFVVKKANFNSTSKKFSQRTYSVYKILLGSEMVTSLLLKFYTFLIRRRFYVMRWLKILDVIVEKEKVPVLRKLCIIQLIKAYL